MKKTKSEKAENAYLFLLVSTFILTIDQATKQLAKKYLADGSITFIPYILGLDYTTNTGVSFGLFKGFNLFFVVVSLTALIFFIYFFFKENYKLETSIVIGGLLGNLVDRIIYGSVIDFINLKFYAIFNVADMAVCLGIGMIVIREMRKEKN
jgi:signal peptidase II